MPICATPCKCAPAASLFAQMTLGCQRPLHKRWEASEQSRWWHGLFSHFWVISWHGYFFIPPNRSMISTDWGTIILYDINKWSPVLLHTDRLSGFRADLQWHHFSFPDGPRSGKEDLKDSVMSLLMLPRPDSNTNQELSAQLDDPDCVSAERGHGWVKRSANSQKPSFCARVCLCMCSTDSGPENIYVVEYSGFCREPFKKRGCLKVHKGKSMTPKDGTKPHQEKLFDHSTEKQSAVIDCKLFTPWKPTRSFWTERF